MEWVQSSDTHSAMCFGPAVAVTKYESDREPYQGWAAAQDPAQPGRTNRPLADGPPGHETSRRANPELLGGGAQSRDKE
jgi:hypothetical protein